MSFQGRQTSVSHCFSIFFNYFVFYFNIDKNAIRLSGSQEVIKCHSLKWCTGGITSCVIVLPFFFEIF